MFENDDRLNDFELCSAAHLIVELICWRAERISIPSFKSCRGGLPNPGRYQTSGGLFLRFYNESPRSLWTPWGEWCFIKPNSSRRAAWRSLWTEMGGVFGAVLHTRLKWKDGNTLHPVFSLTKCIDRKLPEAAVLELGAFAKDEVALAAWKALTHQYERRWGAKKIEDENAKKTAQYRRRKLPQSEAAHQECVQTQTGLETYVIDACP